ncbi:tetratricopeptide repeat protein [Polaromonas sp. YR568]|uniref:tetratricopeptide repeat protein n=1 Tax=Polaromonas sp. YR568 TaxID=1855301 RepID=UPI00398C217E
MGLFDRLTQRKSGAVSLAGDVALDAGRNAEHWLEKGLQLEQQGELDEALSCYQSAIDLMPTLARAHFNRGNILLDRGDAQSALEAYEEAILYKPDSAAAHFNMGNACLRLGAPEAAVVAYRQAVALKPDFADAHAALEVALEVESGYAETRFNQGLAEQDLEQPDRAKEFYRQALAIKPDHIAACNNLGVILLAEKQADQAASYFQRALEADPNNAATHTNLGSALQALGKMEEAITHYRRAAQIAPDNAATWVQLGNSQGDQGQHSDAVASYRRALDIEPDNPEASLNQGVALLELGQLDPAEQCLRRTLEIEPGSAEAHNSLGLTMRKRHQMDAALLYFQKALSLRPGFAAAHINIGSVLQALGQDEAAAQSYQRALDINPDSAIAHSNHGSVLKSLGKLDQAEASCRRALEIDPQLAEAHNNLGVIFSRTNRLTESIESFERAIRTKGDYANAYSNLGGVLKDIGRLAEASKTLHQALTIDPDSVLAHNNLLFIHNYVADLPAGQLLADAKRFGEVAERLAQPRTKWQNPPDPERVLRVGFVSGDLSGHPVGFFLEGVLKALASRPGGRLELFAYPTFTCDDETSARLRACCKSWHSVVGLSDEALAQRITEDGIDILIDLSGHTAHNRLTMFAWKPAPIQVSWLGYFATTGVAAIDYFIADPWTLPPDQEVNFSEQIWRLPETRLCFTAPAEDVAVGPLPALANGYVTFGSFNNLSKMNDAVVTLWAQVLNAVPDSRLFLKYQQLGEASVRQNTRDRFAAHGIKPERLIFESYASRSSYLATYQRVDIALDPFPFPGGTTTAEALWMGIPVLTLAGERFLSRQGFGLLMNAGLPEWIATDTRDYLARAVSHAGDLQRLASLRRGLRQQVLDSPVFDASRFARRFETALHEMWQKWCARHHRTPSPG